MLEVIVVTIILAAFAAYGGAIIWLLVRTYGYTFGKHRDDIYCPEWLSLAALLSFAIPIFNWIMAGYLAFYCKSVKVLVQERQWLIANLTAADVVGSVEDQIRAERLTAEEWVRTVWKKRSTHEWIAELEANDEILREILEDHLQVDCSSMDPVAPWLDIVSELLYRKERG